MNSIAVNRVQSGGVTGQKRLYETVLSDEDGRNVPRKKITEKKKRSLIISGKIECSIEKEVALISCQWEESDVAWEQDQEKRYP